MEVFHRALSGDGQLAVAVAAIKALTSVIENSKATTMMGLEIELSRAADALRRCNPTSISLSAGCELFMRCAWPTHAFSTARALLTCRAAHKSPPQLRDANSCVGSGGPAAFQGVAHRARQHVCGDIAEGSC